ncbi:MAG: cobalamin-dependent protein, partial [Planctomycetota bacterium]
GRRAECFDLVTAALNSGTPAEELICDVVWPALAQVERLYRDDRINTATEHMAGRINRTVADQLQAHLPKKPSNSRRVLITCADGPHEELGAQMVSDLFQADGWEVSFVGGGVPDDEVLALVGQLRPNLMIVFGAQPEAVPNTRALVERIREVGTCPTMNILVTGGIFNRAEGLWREVGADAFCEHLRNVLPTANGLAPRTGNPPRVGLVKRRRRKRKGAAADQTPHAPVAAGK